MAVAPGTIWMIRLGASGDDCRYEFLDGFAVDGVVSDLIQEWAELPRCRPHKNWCREDVEWQSILNTTFPLHLAHTHPEHTGRPSGGSGGRKLEILDRWIAGSLDRWWRCQLFSFPGSRPGSDALKTWPLSDAPVASPCVSIRKCRWVGVGGDRCVRFCRFSSVSLLADLPHLRVLQHVLPPPVVVTGAHPCESTIRVVLTSCSD